MILPGKCRYPTSFTPSHLLNNPIFLNTDFWHQVQGFYVMHLIYQLKFAATMQSRKQQSNQKLYCAKVFIISAAANVSTLQLKSFQPFDYHFLFLGAVHVAECDREIIIREGCWKSYFQTPMSFLAPYLLSAGRVQLCPDNFSA